MSSYVLEPKSARALVVKQGGVVRITDLDGQQVADFVCFSEHDHAERFSQAKTRVRNWTVRISTGHQLISNRDRTMFTIVADTVGVHDIMFCECHSFVYEHMFKLGPRNGCFENLAGAVAPYGIPADDLPDPLDIFMRTDITEDRELSVGVAASGPGDYIELRAEMDCLIAVSACADDYTDCNGGRCTRIGVDINPSGSSR